MRYFSWLARIALFFLIFGFAVKNADTVAVHYYAGYVWHAPLALVLLVFFCAGAALGVLASLGHVFRRRREMAALKRALHGRERNETPRAAA